MINQAHAFRGEVYLALQGIISKKIMDDLVCMNKNTWVFTKIRMSNESGTDNQNIYLQLKRSIYKSFSLLKVCDYSSTPQKLRLIQFVDHTTSWFVSS